MPTIKLKQGSRRLANQASQKAAQQQASTEPVPQAPPTIAELEAKRDAQKALLAKVEKQVLDLESRYVRSANPLGTAVTGYEGFLTGLPVPAQNMRIFSGAAHTPPQSAPTAEAGATPATSPPLQPSDLVTH
mmetsp:Transcript_15468/g.46681  ORF Transcript_15468/g.46681 Transcript_15468/m.46681 type:complete len:132 (+) Transcript_15468:276-671(+)